MTTTTPKHRLRWYQYSLRSLFVLTVLVAAVGSWFAWKKQQVERQRAAADTIEDLGGWVLYDFQFDDKDTLVQNWEPYGPAWLRSWLGDDVFARVTEVYLGHTDTMDSDLSCLENLPRLKSLSLRGTKLTDAGLKQLEGLTQLKVLSLDNTEVTNAGLKYLRGLTQLEQLWLINTQVTDEGVQKLKEALPNCKITR